MIEYTGSLLMYRRGAALLHGLLRAIGITPSYRIFGALACLEGGVCL